MWLLQTHHTTVSSGSVDEKTRATPESQETGHLQWRDELEIWNTTASVVMRCRNRPRRVEMPHGVLAIRRTLLDSTNLRIPEAE